ncbi:MAG: hypothetical protein ETSY1_41385 [Candidatus Entotheonella factor]|uniref:PIN domain-containing protein n=1 Tax=Entotheonella factor TaxID=1429438 RepID=W4L4H0_ENTF1|nr:MAG: hypothetical protein ETSY1_41385 [Candidatus Entotheonella factor]
MILVDTGPLVALFDPRDAKHTLCRTILRTLRDRLVTTVPVLTEAFHMLGPASRGANNLRSFVQRDGLAVWLMDASSIQRAFELMEQYGDHPMDLADASLLVAAETLPAYSIFTIDRQDFATYRVRRGHRLEALQMLDSS